MKLHSSLLESDFLLGLIFACPLESESEICPFKKVRQLPVDDRLNLLENLSQNNKECLFKQHKKCLSKNDIGYSLQAKTINSNFVDQSILIHLE